MSKIDRLCDQLGIRIVPYATRRGPWETCARQVLRKLVEQRGEGHLSIVIKAIKASPANALELWSETILAVSDVLTAFPDLEDRGLALLDQIETLDLRTMRLHAKRIAIAPVSARNTLRILLTDALRPSLPAIPAMPKRMPPTVRQRRQAALESRQAA